MVRKRRKVKPEKIVKRAKEAFERGLISREFYEEILKKYGFEPEKPKPIREIGEEAIEEPGQLRPPLEERAKETVEVKPRFKPKTPRVPKPKLKLKMPRVSMIAPFIITIVIVSGGYYLYKQGYILGLSFGPKGAPKNLTGNELYDFSKIQKAVYQVNIVSRVQNKTLNYTLTVGSKVVVGRDCWIVWVNATSEGQFIAAYRAIIAKDNGEVLVSSVKSATGPLVNVTALTLIQQAGIGLFNETAIYAGEETITVPVGTVKCKVYNILIGTTNMTFWISDKYPIPVMWRSETPGVERTALLVLKE